MQRIALGLAALLLAGCLHTAAPPASPQPDVAPATSIAQFSDCIQFHAAFPAQANSFMARLPPGFTISTDASGLTTLLVEPTSCANSTFGPLALLWITIPVTPPTWANGTPDSSLLIEMYSGNAAFTQWAHAAGMSLLAECSCAATSTAAGPLLADGFTASAKDNHYDLKTLLTPSPGTYAGGMQSLFTGNSTHAARLLSISRDSPTRGLGEGELQYQGTGGAPPILTTKAAHVVEHLSFTLQGSPIRFP